MGIEIIGAGKKITARLITVDTGSDAKPWLVFKSDDNGITPIAAHENKETAQAQADALNREEDERCELVNARRRRQRKPEIARGYFDDYFVRHRDSPL